MATAAVSPASISAPAWPHWLFRIVATLGAVLLFVQSILAGIFIGDKHAHTAFVLHRENAFLATAVVVVLVVAAILSVWPGRGIRGPIIMAIALLVVTLGEVAAGFAKLTALHVPLAVALIGLASMMAAAAWRRPIPA